MSKAEFKALPPFSKGVAVYMSGYVKEEPNIPKHFEYRGDRNRREYERGQRAAVQNVQDNP